MEAFPRRVAITKAESFPGCKLIFPLRASSGTARRVARTVGMAFAVCLPLAVSGPLRFRIRLHTLVTDGHRVSHLTTPCVKPYAETYWLGKLFINTSLSNFNILYIFLLYFMIYPIHSNSSSVHTFLR